MKLTELRGRLATGSPLGEDAPYAVINTLGKPLREQELAVAEAAAWLGWGASVQARGGGETFVLTTSSGDYRLPPAAEGFDEASVVVPRYTPELAEQLLIARPKRVRKQQNFRMTREFIRFAMPGRIFDRHEIITAILHARSASDWPVSTNVETSTAQDGKTTYYLAAGDIWTEVGVLHDEEEIQLIFMSHRSAMSG